MSSEKRRPVAVLITHGLEMLDAQGAPVEPSGSVRRAEVEALLPWDILAVGAVAPHLAAEVRLDPGVDITLTLGANHDALIENGRLILAATRAAASARDRGRIRMLRSWFPCVLRMREVHEFLDGLEPAQAEQIVGMRSGLGRTPRPAEQAGLVLTMDLLRATGLSAAAAADRIAAVPNAGVSADRLRNLHSELGPLVRCLGEGYAIAASEVPCLPWGQHPDDEWSVYVRRSEICPRSVRGRDQGGDHVEEEHTIMQRSAQQREESDERRISSRSSEPHSTRSPGAPARTVSAGERAETARLRFS